MMLQTLRLQHMPPELVLHIALYQDVKNAAYLRRQLLAGNSDFEYAFIDASMVLSTMHVFAAAFRALNDYLHQRLKSHNVHSEIVFAFSPNNNIGEAFRKFGVSDTTTDLLVIKVATSPAVTFETVKEHLDGAIEGTGIEFNDENLRKTADTGKVKKAYKLAVNVSPKNGGKLAKQQINGDDGKSVMWEERRSAEASVIGAIALRGAA